MLKKNLFLSNHRTSAYTAVLLGLGLAEEKHPDSEEQERKEHGVLIYLHLLFTETFF